MLPFSGLGARDGIWGDAVEDLDAIDAQAARVRGPVSLIRLECLRLASLDTRIDWFKQMESSDLLCGATYVYPGLLDVLYHCGTHANHDIFTYLDALLDYGASSDIASLAKDDVSRQVDSRSDVAVIINRRIVSNRSVEIDAAESTDVDICGQYASRRDDGSFADRASSCYVGNMSVAGDVSVSLQAY